MKIVLGSGFVSHWLVRRGLSGQVTQTTDRGSSAEDHLRGGGPNRIPGCEAGAPCWTTAKASLLLLAFPCSAPHFLSTQRGGAGTGFRQGRALRSAENSSRG